MFNRTAKTTKNRRNVRVRTAQNARKAARKTTRKEGSRIEAAQRVQALSRHFVGLPLWLWAVVVPLAYNIAKKTWEKESEQQALREAKRTLREARGFRALPDDVDVKGRK